MNPKENRKFSCGALDATSVGVPVELNGWVHRRRDHGGLIFIDLRDRDGLTQLTFDPAHAGAFALAETLRSEDVACARGIVRRRPAGTENARLRTGQIEVAVDELTVHARSLTPPFPVAGNEEVDEALRLRYRYLDLRRSKLQRNLTVRHRIIKAMRDFFDTLNFVEIETPVLIKSTPEGARDYLVPSRLHPGSFYALPQSPQLLKQILMIGGFGRYMQIARCFRDEDSRSDRQPEFTQLDVEMSFVTQENVIALMEACMLETWQRALGVELARPFPRLSFEEARRRFGSDKPDLRFGFELSDATELFVDSEFGLFREIARGSSGRIVAHAYPNGNELSRREFDALVESAKELGAKGLVWIALGGDATRSPIQKFLNPELIAQLSTRTGAQPGDAILLVADEAEAAWATAGKLRVEIAERLGLRDPKKFSFVWVLGFPLFERDPESGAVAPAHHPFTAPDDDQWDLIERDPLAMRAQHYDLVLNGYELGSGSIRIHKPEFQRKIFAMLGLTEQQVAERFGFFLEALDYGAPPHGGMALGLDRIAMLACGETSIRDVIAFPKNQVGRDVMMDAPTPVPPNLLRDLALESKVKPAAPA